MTSVRVGLKLYWIHRVKNRTVLPFQPFYIKLSAPVWLQVLLEHCRLATFWTQEVLQTCIRVSPSFCAEGLGKTHFSPDNLLCYHFSFLSRFEVLFCPELTFISPQRGSNCSQHYHYRYRGTNLKVVKGHKFFKNIYIFSYKHKTWHTFCRLDVSSQFTWPLTLKSGSIL